jgi:hypothetical protein
MRLGRRLLVCAALAGLTRNGHGGASPASDGTTLPGFVRVKDTLSAGARTIGAWFGHLGPNFIFRQSDFVPDPAEDHHQWQRTKRFHAVKPGRATN